MKAIIIPVVAGLILAGIMWMFKIFISKLEKYKGICFSRRDLSFNKYFVTHGNEVVDYVVYQLGLRPSIPIVDLLYLEFLHYLLVKGYINTKVIIFPIPDLSIPYDETGEVQFNQFKKNVLSVFKTHRDRVTVLSYHPVLPEVNEMFSPIFLHTLKYTGSEQYINRVKRISKRAIKDITHFSKHHPKELRLVNLFVHAMRGWISLRKLETTIELQDGLRIGILIWETGLDKLGQFMCFWENKGLNVSCSVYMGKTLFVKGRPLPVFDNINTLNMFCTEDNIVKLVSQLSSNATRKYIEILQVILKQNYFESLSAKENRRLAKRWLESRLISHPKESVKLTEVQHMLLWKIQMLKANYI